MKGDRKTDVNDLFMQNSHSSVLILSIRSAVERGGTKAAKALECLLFFLESANHVARTCQYVPVVNIKTAHSL